MLGLRLVLVLVLAVLVLVLLAWPMYPVGNGRVKAG